MLTIIMWYLIVGFIAVHGMCYIHMFVAELRGYKVHEYWCEHDTGETLYDSDEGMRILILSIITWPYIVIDFYIRTVPYYYSLYEKYEEKEC